MATQLLNITSRQYTPRVINLNPTLPAGVSEISIAFTRESWPVGDVLKIEVSTPDGQPLAAATYPGGNLKRKDGVTDRLVDTFTVRSAKSGETLPAGEYQVVATVLQTMRTAVTVTRNT